MLYTVDSKGEAKIRNSTPPFHCFSDQPASLWNVMEWFAQAGLGIQLRVICCCHCLGIVTVVLRHKRWSGFASWVYLCRTSGFRQCHIANGQARNCMQAKTDSHKLFGVSSLLGCSKLTIRKSPRFVRMLSIALHS